MGVTGPAIGIVKVEKNRALYRARLTCPATQHARPGVPGLGGPLGLGRAVYYLGVPSLMEARVKRKQRHDEVHHLPLRQDDVMLRCAEGHVA